MVLVHRCRMGVADRANRGGDRPAPREGLPGSAHLGSRASCLLRARQHHADTLLACSALTRRARPTTVIPAEVALGVISLHKAGIHSPGLGASPRLTRSDALHENCLRHLQRWILGSSPRMTMSPGVAGDTGSRASGECPPCAAPHHRRPRRSRGGRHLAPPSGDPFAATRHASEPELHHPNTNPTFSHRSPPPSSPQKLRWADTHSTKCRIPLKTEPPVPRNQSHPCRG